MKSTIFSIIIALVLIGGAILLSRSGSVTDSSLPGENVFLENGRQIVEINAKGGYQPRKSVANAGVPTLVRFKTEGNFDCSSSIRIPKLGLSKILPRSGVTDIEIGTMPEGTLRGSCGMGMYPFEIEFQKR